MGLFSENTLTPLKQATYGLRSAVQTDNGIARQALGLSEMDREQNRGNFLTPEIDRHKVFTPKKECEID